MEPDPLNPNVGDVFFDGTENRRIIFVGDKGVITRNMLGADERFNLRIGVANWTPVPQAWLDEPFVIYQWAVDLRDGGTLVGWSTHKTAGLTGHARLVNPDGTWEELGAS